MRHKHADLIHKWAEGEEIQVKREGEDRWIDVPFPSWFKTDDYRVKPKPIVFNGWVHICNYEESTRYVGSTIYSSEELALQNKPINGAATIKIEWEE